MRISINITKKGGARQKITDEANAIINEFNDIDNQKAVIVYNPKWHKGIIGIVASRLTEKYYRPALS